MERGPEGLYRQHSREHRQSDVLDGNQYQAEIIVAGARQHKQDWRENTTLTYTLKDAE